ncbi:glyoxalase domain-containing protein 4 isoform X2 [Contarinia nasturtii]|uniref:glyoxalase domain-containing protein 4 isoform X2 n=1 Tax=Contarinia nasturtii TaxID=265458 RepID=UPI0012D45C50|nr:glyoxalase domain-containing protein 4 isoform X2 [Contarinia nasturtii]
MVSARALHFVLKIGDRGANINFFRNILGMQVLRHEEFTEGCAASCNGPYDNRWSKTMIGYGPESNHFVVELTYNYGVTSYDLGNDFGGIAIKANGIVDRVKKQNYSFTVENEVYLLKSPDGYKFYVTDAQSSGDPVQSVIINSNDLQKTQSYWTDLLNMKLLNQSDNELALKYDGDQTKLIFKKIDEKIDRKTAFGRIAFAIAFEEQTKLSEEVTKRNAKVIHPLTSLDTPGKATVRVIILSDPNELEICFVDDEGFAQLSQVDPGSDADLDKNVQRDPFQK